MSPFPSLARGPCRALISCPKLDPGSPASYQNYPVKVVSFLPSPATASNLNTAAPHQTFVFSNSTVGRSSAGSTLRNVKPTASSPSTCRLSPGVEMPSEQASPDGPSAGSKHRSKKVRFNNPLLVEQHHVSGSASSSKRIPKAASRYKTAVPSQETYTIDLTHDIDKDGSLPQDCIKKLPGFTTVSGKINTRLNFDDIWAIVLRLKDLFSSNNIHIFHPTWANTYRAEQPNTSFGREKYDKFIILPNIDMQLKAVLLVKSSKCVFYFDSISNGSIKQDFQERVQFIIGVNKATIGQDWQHLHTNTCHKQVEDHSGLLTLLSMECILRAISLPDVSPTAQTLRYKYAEMVLTAHPLLPEYLLVERTSIKLEAFERDVEWVKGLKLSEPEVMIKDEDEVEYPEDSDDEEDRPRRTQQLFVFHPVMSLRPECSQTTLLQDTRPSRELVVV
ncbi:hypothetical protein DL98DRAFT_570116 [Cadophora sp. DSE1049]|nr:hypothetical protein DL98DRAFT_570116 [Cadophora sp. DSE1049]